MKLKLSPSKAQPAGYLRDYKSVEVSMFPLEYFDQIVDTASFCSAPGSGVVRFVPRPGSPQDVIVTHTLRDDEETHVDALLMSGIYVLLVTNCGGVEGLGVAGTVSVRNPHGYLQANEHRKTGMYGWLTLLYMASFLLWVGLYARRWSRLSLLQSELMSIHLLAVGECLAMRWLYSDLNSTGEFSETCYSLGTAMSLAKTCMLLRWAAQAPQTLGIDIEPESDLKFQVALVLHAGAAIHFRSSLIARDLGAYGVDTTVGICAVPVIITGMALFGYGLYSLESGRRHALEKQRAQDPARLLVLTMAVLVVAGIAAVAALVAQFADPGRGTSVSKWGMHAMFSEGFSQVVCALALGLSTLVWRPTDADAQSQRYGKVQVEADLESVPVGAAAGIDGESTKPEQELLRTRIDAPTHCSVTGAAVAGLQRIFDVLRGALRRA
eukprot:CAMPEP_0176187136 /NCGR_PEP_ID=MMETSP0121_2-20121125/2237_1 /TAXON_ID=160619 /ORGANISM="Kryptoperidinium foliaceum, Strain CCMP 1326" /LENGTH=437 /DNA_ID=CAMNT_0017525657 /DNA_START=154 /DNA_END=1464 /DNA_ORIENTATION=-